MDNEFVTAAEARRRVETGLLSKFEEIAQTFLGAMSSDSRSDKILFSLQEYLDGTVRIGESIHRRRSVLLAVHDMNEEREAPLSLQSKTLAKLKFLKVDPTPEVRLYQDIATALLKMEVVVRLYASQSVRRSEAGEVPLPGSYALGNPGAPSPALR
jgi:hypothetical protein